VTRPGSDAWWIARGVSPEVRDARPYVPWTTDDRRAVEEAYEGLSPKQMGQLLGWAAQQPGLVIYRHPWWGNVDREDLRFIYPEIRPDAEVWLGEEYAKYLFPPASLIDKGWFHFSDPEEKETDTRDAYARTLDWLEQGDNLNYLSGVELSRKLKTRRVITHAEAYEGAPATLQRHLDRWHPGGVVYGGTLDGEHFHPDPLKVRREVLAKRLDVNPLLRERPEPQWWLLGIEGCIKADSMLSYVLREDLPAGVVSVPSVSLWKASAMLRACTGSA
jgi:hypothetical protein